MAPEVRIFGGRGDMLAFLAERWLAVLDESVARRGFFSVALSGGRTPADFFLRLSLLEDRRYWQNTHVFMSDERCVPLDSPDSNFGLLRSALLSKVPIPSGNVHPVPVDPDDPAVSAERYAKELKYFFRLENGSMPVFDLIHLGIGGDGHTASLFPGSNELRETRLLCAAASPGQGRHDRITLTLPVINNAENVIMLVTGAEKASVVKRVIEGRDGLLPAALVRPRGNLLYVLDKAASSELRSL